MARGGKKGGKPKKVMKAGIKKEAGYLYYLDKQGNIARAKMAKPKKGKKAKMAKPKKGKKVKMEKQKRKKLQRKR